jgi:hypothetical protein
METAITCAVTGAPLPTLTQAGSGSSETNVLTWTTPFQVVAGARNSAAQAPSSWAIFRSTASSPLREGIWSQSRFKIGSQHSAAYVYALYTATLMGANFAQSKLASQTFTQSKAQHFVCKVLSELTWNRTDFTGTDLLSGKLFEAAAPAKRRIYWAIPNISAESATASQCIFDAVQAFYLSHNTPRDQQIAQRLTALYRDALDEGEAIRSASIVQFKNFFLANPGLGFPRVTLSAHGALRARWIKSKGNFVAIEFTGQPEAKLIAEIQGLEPPLHVSSEPIANIVEAARALGGSFA